MQRFLSKNKSNFLMILVICLFYAGCGSSKDCWVCDGDGENNCVVCADVDTNMDDCAFCIGRGFVTCTFCNGTGIMK